MAERSAKTRGSSRTTLLLWFIPPLFELVAVLMLTANLPEVAGEAIFGSPGTEVVITAVLVVLVLGTAVAWSGAVSSAIRAVLSVGLFVAAGSAAALLVGFLTGGSYVILAVLLAHSALSIALIGGMVIRAGTVGCSPRRPASRSDHKQNAR